MMSLTDKAKDKAKKSPTLLLGVLVVAHLMVISLNRVPGQPNVRYAQALATGGFAPVHMAFAYIVGGVKGGWQHYFTLRDARAENEQLKVERVERDKQLAALQEKARLFDEFTEFKNWQSANAYDGVQAMVVARDSNQFFNTLVIDRGSTQGVQKDQPVVASNGGLVGRVIEVGLISARVLLITDERHASGAEVMAQTADTRILGVVEGKKQFLCEMRFIVAPEKIEAGEEVLTSGQDGLYPKGLLIGRVRGAGTIAAPQVVEVEPAAPLSKLETVAVLAVPADKLRNVAEELNKEEQEKDNASARRKRGAGR
jgi:rod shape-determining protein MreC